MASSTLAVMFSAIAALSRYEAKKPCEDKLVQDTLRAVRRKASQPVGKLPLLMSHIEQMASKVEASFSSIRDFFMVLIMTLGFLRQSEAVELKTDQVWIEEMVAGSKVLFIFVETSKTDLLRKGHTIVLEQAQKKKIDPVRWFELLLKSRNQLPVDMGWLLCNQVNGNRLSRTTPNHVVKKWLTKIGVPDVHKYGSHSCRKGGATAAAAAGVEERLIKRHGNWRSDSVHVYITDSLENRLSVSHAIFASKA